MADVEEPQFSTLAERIAALNKQKNFSSSGPAPSLPSTPSASAAPVQPARPTTRRPPPPPPSSASAPAVPTVSTSALAVRPAPPPIPKGPTRSASASSNASTITTGPASKGRPLGPPPKLPPRQPSNQQLQVPRATTTLAVNRRPSSDSVRSSMSAATTSTTLSRVSSTTSASDGSNLRKLPPAFGATKLPLLPPPRQERETKESEAAAQDAGAAAERAPALPSRPGSSRHPSSSNGAPGLPPRLPPRRPSRTSVANSYREEDEYDEAPAPALPTRRPTVRPASDMDSGDGGGSGVGAKLQQFSKWAGAQIQQQKQKQQQQQQPPPSKWAAPQAQQQLQQRAHQITLHSHDDDAADGDRPPPPPPLSSRPSRSQIDNAVRGAVTGAAINAAKGAANDTLSRPRLPTRPRPSAGGGGSTSVAGFYPKKSDDEECLVCRDFSGPDAVAAQFPISSLPRHDTVNYVARGLCDQFPSQTDKARAIFTWCHHNIAYDVDGFFGGCIPRGQTMAEVIFSGKAVCEGYARVYEAIALAAGLECVVVGGHGKGFGFHAVRPGDRIPPPNPTGHAWSAVRIDGGEWKLLDACWGAGNVNDKRAQRYEKKFTPSMFTMTNETFGERHFPENPDYFFRADGRRVSWSEYVVDKVKADPVMLYSNGPEQFIAQESVEPQAGEISVQRGDANERIAFRFGRSCRHWSPETPGHDLSPYPMFLQSVVPEDESRKGTMHDIEFDYDEPLWFWADIPRRDLGEPGSTLHCYAMTTVDGRDMRGRTMADVRKRLGRCSYSMQAICSWKLV